MYFKLHDRHGDFDQAIDDYQLAMSDWNKNRGVWPSAAMEFANSEAFVQTILYQGTLVRLYISRTFTLIAFKAFKAT